MDKIYTNHWIELPTEVRSHLRKVFGLSKSGITEVRDQVLVSDGTTNDDLAVAFTKEKLCEYIGSDETFARAWEIAISKAKYEIDPPKMIVGEFGIKEMKELDAIIEAGPEAMDNKPVVAPSITNNLPVEPVATVPVTPTAFCDSCDSLGVRHKKDCPKKDF